MFLLKRPVTFVLLMMAFGILLSDVAFQPAQGLECYSCPSKYCKDKSDMGVKQPCRSHETHCLKVEYESGQIGRKCSQKLDLSCDTFTDVPDPTTGTTDKVKACFCDTDLCNGSNVSSASHGLGLLFLLAVTSLLGALSWVTER
ncbi:unnamed protein product [Orchesella dallaii]|uniref:Protein quiver n=1 Tax=Orchesella dallaii TaxID=48710 RepID=A0ABP1R1P2_9HEXA